MRQIHWDTASNHHECPDDSNKSMIEALSVVAKTRSIEPTITSVRCDFVVVLSLVEMKSLCMVKYH